MANEQKQNGREIYFQTSAEISPRVNQFIKQQIENLGIKNKSLEETILELPKKRENKTIMRANLTYLFYKTLGGSEDIDYVLPALAISELSNYHMYLDNWIYDNKNGVLGSRERLNKITAASEVIRDLAQLVIENSQYSNEIKRKISKRFSRATIDCCDGQSIDLSVNSKKVDEFNEQEFMEYYFNRCKLLSGALYGLSAEIGALVSGKSEKEIEIAKKFGEQIGTGTQITCDLGDFALKVKNNTLRYYQDQLSDIREDRLTLPIYHVLKYGLQNEKEALINLIGKLDANYEDKLAATKAVVSSGAYAKTKKLLNKMEKQMKKIVYELEENDWRGALAYMSSIVSCNKYLTSVRECDKA